MARAKLPSILSYLLNAFSESIMIFFFKSTHDLLVHERYGKVWKKKNMISIFKVA